MKDLSRRRPMGKYLDIDDVVAGNPKAEKELAELREEIDLLKEKYFNDCGKAKLSGYNDGKAEVSKENTRLKQALEVARGALENSKQFIINGVAFGYISMPEEPDPALDTPERIEEALARINSVLEVGK